MIVLFMPPPPLPPQRHTESYVLRQDGEGGGTCSTNEGPEVDIVTDLLFSQCLATRRTEQLPHPCGKSCAQRHEVKRHRRRWLMCTCVFVCVGGYGGGCSCLHSKGSFTLKGIGCVSSLTVEHKSCPENISLNQSGR